MSEENRYIEIKQSVENGKWYGHVKAGNHEVTDVSQGYSDVRSAKEWAARDHADIEDVRIVP